MTDWGEAGLRRWLIDFVAEQLDVAPHTIDVDSPLRDLGLSSRSAVEISGALGALLDRPLSPELVYEFPTITAIAQELGGAARPERPLAQSPLPTPRSQDVAIVGMGCRFPGGVSGVQEYWELLVDGRHGIRDLPAGRWATYAETGPAARDLLGRTVARGGFLDDISGFDAAFFGISPSEAEAMDPQQRLALEVAWEALEDAGTAPDRLAGSDLGVFFGACTSDYLVDDISQIGPWSAVGSAMSIIANRISYLLGVHGPSMVVDTACSASLVAVHLAARSLVEEECSLALAGGVNLLLSPGVTVNFTQAGVLAPDGVCRTFDDSANGYGRGEGCGVVVLKRLPDALRDGDRVWAVVRGSAVAQDGRSNGLMAPSPAAQKRLLEQAYRRAAVNPGSVDYVEAHGTATVVGDAVEAQALGAVVGSARPAGEPCLVGSVKTNLGHLEAAAGIAGLIKAALAVHHGQIPPSLHFTKPNTNIAFDANRLRVADRHVPWPDGGEVRRAGVSSFGFGGTNAHVILESLPGGVPAVPAPVAPTSVFAVSGSSLQAARRDARRLADWLTGPGARVPLAVLSSALTHGRGHARHRMAVVAADRHRLVDQLAEMSTPGAEANEGTVRADHAPVWVFSGQGSQWLGMAHELLDQEPAFAGAVDHVSTLIEKEIDIRVRDVLVMNDEAILTDVAVVQPILFVVQFALAELLRSYGVTPAAVIGHSMGEVTAAVVAGALSVPDGVRVICRRARRLGEVAGSGLMALVTAPDEVVREHLADGHAVSVAGWAAPESTIISGVPDAVRAAVDAFATAGLDAALINVDVASHSPMVDSLLPTLTEDLIGVASQRPELPIYSTVSPDSGRDLQLDGAYWVANLRQPVRLTEAVRAAAADGHRVFLEISPHPVLVRSIHETLTDAGVEDGVVWGALRRDSGETQAIAETLARLHCLGHSVRWARGMPPVGIPPRVWDHRSYWLRAPIVHREHAGYDHPLLGRRSEPADQEGMRLWEASLCTSELPWLSDHRLEGEATFSAAWYIEWIFAAARSADFVAPVVRDLVIHSRLLIDARPLAVQTIVRRDGADTATVTVHARSVPEQGWTQFASARLHDDPPGDELPDRAPEVSEAALTDVAVPDFYTSLADAGIEIGSGLRSVVSLARRDGFATAELAAPAGIDGLQAPSALLDGCLQIVAAAVPAAAGTYAVVGLDSVVLRPAVGGPTAVRVEVVQKRGGGLVADLWLLSGDGVIGHLRGVRLMRAGHRTVTPADWVFEVRWRPALPVATAVSARWHLVGAGDGVADALANHVVRLGGQCTVGLVDAPIPTDAQRVVYLNPLDIDEQAGGDPDTAIQLLLEAGKLTRELADRAGGTRLHLVTRHAQAVGDDGRVDPAQAALWGFGRSLALEHPRLWGGLLDVGGVPVADAAALVAAEFADRQPEPMAVYRDGSRLVPRLSRVEPGPAHPSIVRPTGAHVVVGPTGRIGPHLVRRLVDLGARHLVLIARRGVAASTIADLEARGVDVTVVAADVVDGDAMTTLFQRFGADLPPLAGVYHAAFTECARSIVDASVQDVVGVLRPKAASVELLHRLSTAHDPAVFAVYSSTTGLLGSPQLAHYAAASCYVDALVHRRRRTGLSGSVINWGPWDSGLAGSPLADVITDSGLRLMPAGSAAPAIDHLVAGQISQLVVVDADWRQVDAASGGLAIVADLVAVAAGQGDVPGEVTTHEAVPQGEKDIGHRLRQLVATTLGLNADELATDRDLGDFGMDSLTSLTLRRRIKQQLGVILPASLLMDRPTIGRLTDYLRRAGEAS